MRNGLIFEEIGHLHGKERHINVPCSTGQIQGSMFISRLQGGKIFQESAKLKIESCFTLGCSFNLNYHHGL